MWEAEYFKETGVEEQRVRQNEGNINNEYVIWNHVPCNQIENII